MSSYSAKIVEDEVGPILVFPAELSRELGWGVGASIRVTGNQHCFKLELLEKGIEDIHTDKAS